MILTANFSSFKYIEFIIIIPFFKYEIYKPRELKIRQRNDCASMSFFIGFSTSRGLQIPYFKWNDSIKSIYYIPFS